MNQELNIKKITFIYSSIMFLSISLYASSKYLDQAFGPDSTGIVTTSFGTNAYPSAIAINKDNAIICGGTVSINNINNFALAQYAANGILNTRFGINGLTTTAIPNSTNSPLSALATQPDGKILAAGSAIIEGLSFIALARYNTDGTLDNEFAKTGIVTTFNTEIFDGAAAQALAIREDGSILVGATAISKGQAVILLLCYTPEGNLDTNFGKNGFVTTTIGDTASLINLHLQEDKIVAIGNSTAYKDATIYSVTLVRYNADGSIDTSFGKEGNVLFSLTEGAYIQAQSTAKQLDNKILVSCATLGATTITRFSTDGAVDTRFNSEGETPGTVVTLLPSSLSSLAIQNDDDEKIILTGLTSSNITAVRYLNDKSGAAGTLDTTFGDNGIIQISLINNSSTLNTTIQNNDDLLITFQSTDNNFETACICTDNDDVLTITTPQNGAVLATPTTLINGQSGIANALIELFLDDSENAFTSTTTQSDGSWSSTDCPFLTLGNHTLTATLNKKISITSTFSANYVPGSTGATGPQGIGRGGKNYVFSYDTTTQTISAPNTPQDISFNTNSLETPINGWAHTSGSASFQCTGATGAYIVSYEANTTKTDSKTTTLSFIATLNGTEVPGSQSAITIPTNTGTYPLAKSFLLTTRALGDILKLQFIGSTTSAQIKPQGAGTTKPSISITINEG